MLDVKIDPGFLRFTRALTRTWRRMAPREWWGDPLDVRFLLLYYCLRTRRNQRVLDVGCRVGIMLSELDLSNTRIGLDVNPDDLRKAAAFCPGGVFIQGDMRRLPFGDESFDVVLVNSALESPSAEEKRRTLAEIARVLRPEGTFYLTMLNRRHARYARLPTYLDRPALERLLSPLFRFELMGFNPLPPPPWAPPLKVMARLPGLWPLLLGLAKYRSFADRGCAFLVQCTKRPVFRGYDTTPTIPAAAA